MIWNNKGGVGKTTLTYHMATEYARINQSKTVLVIDLGTQPNASLALLGSLEALNYLMSQETTVSFYLHLATSPFCFPCPENYLTRVGFFNAQIPENIILLCGDSNLKMVGQSLDQTRNASNLYHWRDVASSVFYFIEGVKRIGAYNDLVVFIDTSSPSFSVLTEMALLGAERLIIPVNADDFSRLRSA